MMRCNPTHDPGGDNLRSLSEESENIPTKIAAKLSELTRLRYPTAPQTVDESYPVGRQDHDRHNWHGRR